MNKNQKRKEDLTDNLLTLGEVADYLQITDKTLLKMIHRKEIPSIKIGSQWRFMKQVIDNWLLTKMQQNRPIPFDYEIKSTKNYIPIDRLITESTILMDIKTGEKKEILDTLVYPLVMSGYIKNKEYYLSKLLQRENIISTGLVNGIAIPHIRNIAENPPGVNKIVAGICLKGTDFNSIDGKKTKLFFLVCSDNEILHIRIIARLTRLFIDASTVLKFVSAASKEEFLDFFITHNHILNFSIQEES